MPGKPRKIINDLRKLASSINKSKAEQEGKKLVDASNNVRKGSRPRVTVQSKKTTKPEVSKVTIVKDNPLLKQNVELPKFEPYYVTDGNPIVLTPAQQAMRDELVKSRQIDLAQYQRELARQGVNTPASHRRATALAVATNPDAILAPPEGPFKLPYRTWYRTSEPVITKVDGKPIMTAEQSPLMLEGESVKDWYDAAGEGILPQGPNATWRKLEIPFQQATSSFDVAGQQGTTRQPAYSLTMRKLGEGLEGLASKYLRVEPLQAKQIQIRKPYIAPSTTVKNKYIAPNTLVTVNPEYLAYQTALKDMAESGIQYDARLEHPEWFIPSGHVIGANDSGINLGSASGHFSTQGFTTRGHMFGEDLDSGLGDLRIIMGEPVDPRKPKKSRTWYPIDSGSREDEIVRFIGINPNKTGMWKQGGILFAKSGIHIKKANRGKFTDYCGGKVTSECIARGKASSNPTIRKRATFAANARKWKHKNGGTIPFWVHNILGGE